MYSAIELLMLSSSFLCASIRAARRRNCSASAELCSFDSRHQNAPKAATTVTTSRIATITAAVTKPPSLACAAATSISWTTHQAGPVTAVPTE